MNVDPHRQGEISRIIEPLRKPIYLLTRSALKWGDGSVCRWLWELRNACMETDRRAADWIARYDERA